MIFFRVFCLVPFRDREFPVFSFIFFWSRFCSIKNSRPRFFLKSPLRRVFLFIGQTNPFMVCATLILIKEILLINSNIFIQYFWTAPNIWQKYFRATGFLLTKTGWYSVEKCCANCFAWPFLSISILFCLYQFIGIYIFLVFMDKNTVLTEQIPLWDKNPPPPHFELPSDSSLLPIYSLLLIVLWMCVVVNFLQFIYY